MGAIVTVLVTLAVLAASGAYGSLGSALEHFVGIWQNAFARVLSSPSALAGWKLYVAAFAGGLLASLSPCILGMLPVNLSYIGAIGVRTRGAAAVVAATFVAGVVAVNAVLGIFSSVFFMVFVEYRSYVNIGVGILTLVMGLWMLGALPRKAPRHGEYPKTCRSVRLRGRLCTRRVSVRESGSGRRSDCYAERRIVRTRRDRHGSLCDRVHGGAIHGRAVRGGGRRITGAPALRQPHHARRRSFAGDSRRRDHCLRGRAVARVAP